MIFEVVFEGYVRGDGPSVGTPSRDDVQAVLGRIMDELLNRGVDSPAIWAEATQGAARIRVVVDSSQPDDALRTA
ncbi:MAG: hypothetical protein ACRDKS_17405, partial [Actinomycetota bacterium]